MDLRGEAVTDWSGSPFDRVLRRGPGVVLAPTVGTIVPGYLLAVTIAHRFNFGELGADELRDEVEPWLLCQLADLRSRFHADYVVFEHGSTGETERYGGCVVHAHMHLVPGGPELAEMLLGASGGWEEVEGLAALSRHARSGYAFLGFGGRAWAIEQPDFPGQWVRRVIARWAGVPDDWDWQLFRGEDQLRATLAALGASEDRSPT